MDAELIIVGSELLRPGYEDAHAAWLTERLNALGADVRHVGIVGDDVARIESAVRAALCRSEVVITSGGLGPTEDDRTREAVARALGVPLDLDTEMAERLEARFREAGPRLGRSQLRQASRPRGARFLENPLGTAPGLLVESGQTRLFALPGVPGEMKAMFEASVVPRLREGGLAILTQRRLKVSGRNESEVDERLRDLYSRPGAEVTILAGSSGIELLLRVDGPTPEAAASRLEELDLVLSERLGDDLYGRDDDTLAAVVGSLLRTSGLTVATAESCTAGLLSGALTEVPGSSAWFRGGIVAYADDLKRSLVGVRVETLRSEGAVSAAVARELAEGARARCGSDYGLGVTGIAGPGGGSEGKPVGLVHVAVAADGLLSDDRALFSGDRELVRRKTVTFALDRLRRRLRGIP